jgi:sugar phosphate isomerase/epimerase
MTEPRLESLDTIEKFADSYDIKVALHNHDRKASPYYWNPEGILAACKGRSQRIGACADVGYWMRSGIDPIAGIRKLKDRLITIQMHDLHAGGPDGHDVPWGTGIGRTEQILREMNRLKLQPTLIGLEYSYDFLDNEPEIAETIAFLNRLSLQMADGGGR